MKAHNWAFSAAAIGVLMLAGLMAEGQVDKTAQTRTENVPRDASGAAPARPIEGQPPVQKVLVSDIGKRVQIIGRLGYPLGELVTIRGAWIRPRGLPNQPLKDDTPYFSVTSVNGRRLETPVIFEGVFFSNAWGARRYNDRNGQSGRCVAASRGASVALLVKSGTMHREARPRRRRPPILGGIMSLDSVVNLFIHPSRVWSRPFSSVPSRGSTTRAARSAHAWGGS